MHHSLSACLCSSWRYQSCKTVQVNTTPLRILVVKSVKTSVFSTHQMSLDREIFGAYVLHVFVRATVVLGHCIF